jgi:signal transduction histidine kinase
MTSLISELLDVEVLKAGQTLALQRRETDLVALTRQLTEDHQRISPNHRIELLSRTATLTGKWDPERIERVIQNLLANAVKYSPNGGQVLVEIEPYTHESCDCAIVRVTDSGMGIPKKDHTRIFEWFARGGNIEGTGIRGTGIGLASAKQIIEQHGGAISVESQEGKGSTFTIRIPISPSPPAKTAISEHAKPETGELCASN